MTITVADLLTLAGADAQQLEHIAHLARRLKGLDAERIMIIAELAEAGIVEAPADLLVPPPHLRDYPAPRRILHRCSECGEEATVTVDGLWFCAADDPTEK